MNASVFVLFNEVTTYWIESYRRSLRFSATKCCLWIGSRWKHTSQRGVSWNSVSAIENISPCLFYRHEFLSSDLKGFITTLDKTFWQIRHIDKAFLMGDWIKTYFKYSTLHCLHFFSGQTLFICNKKIILYWLYCIDFILIWTLIESKRFLKK